MASNKSSAMRKVLAFEKNGNKQDKKSNPSWKPNILLHEISEKYSVVFYTFSHYIVFQYCWDDGIDFYATNRDNVLFWISSEEKEKLLAFEREKKKKFQTCVMYGAP